MTNLWLSLCVIALVVVPVLSVREAGMQPPRAVPHIPSSTISSIPPSNPSNFPSSGSGPGTVTETQVSGSLVPGGSMTLDGSSGQTEGESEGEISSASLAAGSSSGSAIPSVSHLFSTQSSLNSMSSSFGGSESESTAKCKNAFRCIGSPVTRIVKSFADYEKDTSLGGSGGDWNPNQSSGSRRSGSLFSSSPDKLSISAIGRAADIAKCQAIKSALEAERDLQSLQNSLTAWGARSNPDNYKWNPKCMLNNFCRLKCPTEL